MTRWRRARPWWLPSALLGCAFPTDRGPDLRVELETREERLALGERIALRPRLIDQDGSEIPGARFAFRSSDPGVAQTTPEGVILGVGAGRTVVVVDALTFEDATPDSATVEVIPTISIDGVSPSPVRWGEVATIVGTGLDPAAAALISIGGLSAPVAGFVPAVFDRPSSRDTLRVFTPAGAVADGNAVLVRQSGGTAVAPLPVEPFDLFEPNDATPAWLPDGTPFSNPQLAFETGAAPPVDWYRVGPVSGDFTLRVKLGFSSQSGIGQAVVRSPISDPTGTPQWSVPARVDESYCRGLLARHAPRFGIVDYDVSDVPVLLPFKDVSLDSIDIVIEMYRPPFEPVGYELAVIPGYQSIFPADDYEENDFCDRAPTIDDGFAGTLTIDTNHDVDWFRVSPDVTSMVTVRVDCTGCPPLQSAGFAELGDIELVLYQDTDTGLPDTPDELPVVAVGSRFDHEVERLQATVPPGDYLLLVQNAFFTPVSELQLSLTITPEPTASALRIAPRPDSAPDRRAWLERRISATVNDTLR